MENIVEREIIIRPEGTLRFNDIRPENNGHRRAGSETDEAETITLDQVVIRHITKVLKKSRGKVEGPDGAAAILRVNPQTLQHRMKKLGVPYGRRAKGLYEDG